MLLSLLLMAAPSLRLRHRHLIVALHGHQFMQPVTFFAVIVVALVFLRNERLNFRNDILALRKLLWCAQLVKLTLSSVVDDKIRFVCGIKLLLVLLFADRTILLDNGIPTVTLALPLATFDQRVFLSPYPYYNLKNAFWPVLQIRRLR